MADVIYKKGQSANLDNVEIVDGQILVTEDTGEMYIDMSDGTRKKISGGIGEKTITGADYGQSDYASITGERFNDYDDTNGNRALAAGSHAEGTRSIEYDGLSQTVIQNIAGCGCFEIDSKSMLGSYYYYPTFNTTNKTITVKGDARAYAAGDVVSIITDTNFDECATIASVAYNGSDKTVITLQEWPEGLKQGSSNILLNSDNVVKSYTPMTLRVVAKPLVGTTYLGLGAHTEGLGSRALADGAHAEGRETKAVGRYSHTEGRETKAHYAAHAEGWKTQANGDYAHAEGKDTFASGYTAHAEGDSTSAIGGNAHAEGYGTMANGNKSHAEGNMTRATAAATHAEGDQTQATASGAHAEGYKTQATANMSHAEGDNTIASGESSHAEGRWTEAKHQGSHAGGYATRTGVVYQTVIGKYNVGKDNTLFEIGDGTASTEEGRRNAFEVYGDGHAELRTQGETDNSVVTKSTLDNRINDMVGQLTSSMLTREIVSDLLDVTDINTNAIYMVLDPDGIEDNIYNEFMYINGYWELIGSTSVNLSNYYTKSETDSKLTTKPGLKVSGGEIFNDTNNKASGGYAHAEGLSTQATGYASHTEGNATKASGNSAHAEGYNNQAIGAQSHAEGRGTIAGEIKGDGTIAGTASHAEGNNTKALSYCAHAEGNETTASGQYAHVEGYNNTASGTSSHAEGHNTSAEGEASHAEGRGSIASGDISHAEGEQTTAGIRGYKIIAIEGYHAEDQNGLLCCRFIIESTPEMAPASDKKYSTILNGTLTENIYYINSVLPIQGGIHVLVSTNEPMSDAYNQIDFNDPETLCFLYMGTGTTGPASLGNYSHAEGINTKALADCAHAEGYETIASGFASHAGGRNSLTSNYSQFAHGEHVKLSSQTTDGAAAFGRYNDENSSALFAIGNGTDINITYVEVAYNALEQSKVEDGYYYAVDIDDDDLAPFYIPLNPGNVGEYTGHYQDYFFYEKIVETMENPLLQNAFEVYEDGHAEVQTTNIENDKSVVTMETLKKFLVVSATQPNAADYPEGALWIKPV